jgi:outer membrane protein TolC
MKTPSFAHLWVVLVPLTALPSAAVAAEATNALPDRPLALEDACRMALRDHPSLEAMRQRVAAAAATVRMARSAYWPSLDANASATRIQRHSYTGMPPAFSGMIDMTPYTTYGVDLTAGWVLFDGFRRDFDLLAARHGEEASREALADAQRLLLQAVTATYCHALLARETMRIADEDESFSAKLLKDTNNRFAAGTAPRSEVLTFENRRDQAAGQRVEAGKSWRMARAALAELLALPAGELPDNTRLSLPPAAPVSDRSADTEIEYALRQRPDLQAAEAQAQAAAAQQRSADAAWWPRISAVAQGGLARDNDLRFNGRDNENFLVGLQATWNFFGGGHDTAAREAASANARAAGQLKSALALKVAAEVRQNLAAGDASRAQLEIQARVLARALQIRDLVHQEYVGGTAGITRMNEVQNEAVKADAGVVIARIDALLSRANLDAATGRSLELPQP